MHVRFPKENLLAILQCSERILARIVQRPLELNIGVVEFRHHMHDIIPVFYNRTIDIFWIARID